MNAYLLVEGKRSERRLYPSWLSYLAPSFTQVSSPHEAGRNSYYVISGEGYPSLLKDHLVNAIRDVERYGYFDYLVVVLDADEQSVETRRAEVLEAVKASPHPLTKAALRVVVQNRCIETWLLGNRRIYARNAQDPALREYCQFFNVAKSDPELMGVFPGFNTHSQFHAAYVKALFRERKLAYTKRKPGHAQDESYLRELRDRIAATPSDLGSFAEFCRFVGEMTAQSEK